MSSEHPRLNADRRHRDGKLARLHAPHVQPLTAAIERWRHEGCAVPDVDPDLGGVAARILFLHESPGPKASAAHGSGLVSPDNDDQSAERFWRLSREAGLRPAEYIAWNVVPWYVSDTGKNVNATPADAKAAVKYLHEFTMLLPDLRVVVLMGQFAQRWWFHYLLHVADARPLPALAAPHPSPLAHTRNRAVSEAEIVTAMTKARGLA